MAVGQLQKKKKYIDLVVANVNKDISFELQLVTSGATWIFRDSGIPAAGE